MKGQLTNWMKIFARSSVSLKTRKMKIKTSQRYHFLSMRLAKNKKYETTSCRQDSEKHSYALLMNANLYNIFWELAISKKITHPFSFWLSNPTSWNLPWKYTTNSKYISSYTALFVIVKCWVFRKKWARALWDDGKWYSGYTG